MKISVFRGAFLCVGVLTISAAWAEEVLSISTEMRSVSTFSSEVNQPVVPKDPVAAARSAYYFMDYTVARRMWEPLAAAGEADAQFGLFQIYSLGQHVDPDPALAQVWLQLAARQGHAGAEFNLGLAYMRGEAVAKDLSQAWVLFGRAEAQKYPSADRARRAVERRLTPEQLEEARRTLTKRN